MPLPDEVDVNSRTALTAGVAAVGLVVLGALPGWADEVNNRNAGADPGAGIGPGMALLLFVLVPLSILVVIGLVAYVLGGRRHSARYRPQRGWTAAPLWFAGPPDPVAAVEGAGTDDLVRGGASGSW